MADIIDGPGNYRTRSRKRVTIWEIKYPPLYEVGFTCFPATGSIWKTLKAMGENPPYGIWQLNGRYRVLNEHPLDIVEKELIDG